MVRYTRRNRCNSGFQNLFSTVVVVISFPSGCFINDSAWAFPYGHKGVEGFHSIPRIFMQRAKSFPLLLTNANLGRIMRIMETNISLLELLFVLNNQIIDINI